MTGKDRASGGARAERRARRLAIDCPVCYSARLNSREPKPIEEDEPR
jgi:hypothetical protein